jgi:sugar O-acyltransferase (sialic acid O-acetyltransferase NeuD family)
LKKLVVVGAGGFGKEVMKVVEQINEINNVWEILGFVDDDSEKWGTEINGYKIIGGTEFINEAYFPDELDVVLGFGEPLIKEIVSKKLERYNFPTIVYPTVKLSKTIKVGKGCIISEGVILTVDIELGDFVVLNINSTVGHDSIINNFVTVSPGVNISGGVSIGDGSYIGTGANIRDEINIGENSIVGMGSLVVKNIPSNVIAMGVPAKEIKENISRRVFN